MMEMVRFSLSGDPRGQGRPETAVRGGHATIYKPTKDRHYEGTVAAVGRAVMGGREPMTGALAVNLRFRIGVPKSNSKKVRAAKLDGTIQPTSKPDWDNLAKSICDGLNKVVWGDDAQIVRCLTIKEYAETPGIDIEVYPHIRRPR